MVPGRVGEDGKVHPVEHVLELKAHLDKQSENDNEERDSD